MASSYGISTEGFRKKRLFDIRVETEQTLKTLFGNNINLISSSVFSQLVGVMSEREAEIWELAEQVYNSQYLYSAEGVNLDNVLTLLGVTRLPQSKSIQRDLHFKGAVATVIPVGTKFSVEGSPTSVFENNTQVTLVAGADEIQTLAFNSIPVVGSFRLKYSDFETTILNFDATAQNIQDALNLLPALEDMVVTGSMGLGFTITFGGLSGKIDHPMLVVTSNTTGVVTTVVETVKGVTQGTSDAVATTFGPVVAPAFSLNQIDTPVVGLVSVTNTTDAIVGRLTETDAEVRLRSVVAQRARGASTVEAIRANLLTVASVTQAVVFNNVTTLFDENGLPPKSFRAYVQGGEDQDIWDAIWANKPAGIKADGTVAGTVIDSQGLTQNVAFERPVVKNVYMTVKIYKDLTKFPLNGLSLVQDALSGYVNGLNIGQGLIVYPLLIASLDEIPGINDVEIGVDFTPNPALGFDANLAAAVNEILKVNDKTTDIAVTVV